MSTQDTSFAATGNSVPTDGTGFTAWPAPSGNIPFDQGVLAFGVMRGVIGLVDTGTTAPPNAPPAVSYTAKVGTFGGANPDTGAAGVSTAGVAKIDIKPPVPRAEHIRRRTQPFLDANARQAAQEHRSEARVQAQARQEARVAARVASLG